MKTILSSFKILALVFIQRLFLLLLLLTFSACNHDKKSCLELEKGKVIIAGRINYNSDHSRVVRVAATGAIKEIEEIAVIDTLGNFKLELGMYHPQDVQFYYENGIAKLFLEQGDSLYLHINAESFVNEKFPDYEVSGIYDPLVIDIRDYLRHSKSPSFQPIIKNKSVEDYLENLKQHILIEDSILAYFNKQYHPGRDFIKWAEWDITYRNANYLLDYKFYHSINGSSYDGKLFNKKMFPIDDDSAILNSNYGLHLWHYTIDKYITGDSNVLSLLKKNDLANAYSECLDRVMLIEKSGLSRDIICFKLLLALYEKSHEDFLILYRNINKYISSSELKAILSDKKLLSEAQIDPQIVLFDPNSNGEEEFIGDFWNELLSKHKGEILYIDIWTTWCGPCRSEIPYAIDLHNFYSNQPIAFIDLCLSSDYDKWKEVVENKNITGEHYYFNKSRSLMFKNRLMFDGYPTYILINKEGKIIDDNAPRPSSGHIIRKALNNLLEE